MFKYKLFAFAFFSTFNAYSQVTVPNSFTSGTPAKASEVNANFQALATAVNNLNARIAKLEGNITSSDIVGTYKITSLNIENYITTNSSGTLYQKSDYVVSGTAVFNTDGTLTFNTTSTGWSFDLLKSNNQNTVGNPTFGNFAPQNGLNETQTTNWTLGTGANAGTITIGSKVFNLTAGGKILIKSSKDTDGSSRSATNLVILTRL